MLLWLWHRLVATVLIRPLAWEPPYATSVALKTKDKKIKKTLFGSEHRMLSSSTWTVNFSDPHLPLMFPLLCAHNSPHFPYQSTYSAYLPDCAAKHAGSLFTTHQLQPHLFLHTVWAGLSVNCSSQICHDSSSKASVVKLHNVPLCSRPYSDINIHIWNGTRLQEKYQGGEKA